MLLAEANPIPKEGYSKKNLVNIFNSNSGKIIFTLLIEIVAFYIGFFAIHVWKTSLQGIVLGLFKSDRGVSFQNNLENLLQVFFSILRDKKL